MSRPNFFKMLRLDPGETNQKVISDQIEKVKQECNRVRSDAPQAKIREANAFRIYEEEIRRVLGDATLRKQEADERRIQIKAEERIIDGLIKMLKPRGTYTDQDVKNIVKDLEVDEKNIVARIEKAGIIKSGHEESEKPKFVSTRQKTSSAEAASIENDLKGLQLNSLYEFLGNGTSKKSSQELLNKIYDAKKTELGKMVRGNDKHKVWSALLGHVKTHLHDPGNKERYDNYLDDRELKVIDRFIKVRAGKSKLLTEDAINDIVREAHLPNVTADRAIEYIKEWVDRTNGWTLVLSSGFRGVDLLTCGYCGTLAKNQGQPKCHDCGKPLRIPCPNRICNAVVATESECCPQCGFTTGDAPYVDQLVRQANRHLRDAHNPDKSDDGPNKPALHAAETAAAKVLDLWPGFQAALDILNQVKRIRSDHAAAERKQQQWQQDCVAKLERLLSDRKLFEADRYAQRLKVDGINVGLATLQQIASGLESARKSRQHASSLLSSGKVDEAVDKLCDALAVCDDFDEVRIALEKIPPAAPTELHVERSDSHNQITWKVATKQSDVRYAVIRNEGTPPAAHADGTVTGKLLGQVSGARFDDTTAQAGRVYYYSVHAVRGKIRSMDMTTSKAVLRPGKLTGLNATAINGEVCITWILPRGCREVRLTRSPGNVVKAIAGTDFSETNLTIGETYSYAVVPLYDHPETGESRAVRGAKQTVEIVVAKTPDAVTELTAKIDEEQIVIRWVPPKVGVVEIRISPESPSVQQGDILSLTEAKKIGARVTATSIDLARASLPPSRQAYVVPITIEGSTAIIGKCAHVIDLPDVTKLQSHRKATGMINLTWDWPTGIDEVSVAIVRASDNKTLSTIEYTRGAYVRNGNVCRLTYAKEQVYRFVVQTKASGQKVFSKGVSITESLGEEIRIRYRVVSANRKWLLKNKSRIELYLDHDVSTVLHDLIAVGRPDRLPTTIADGETIAEYKRVDLKGTRMNLPIPEEGFVGKLYLKLFLSNPSSCPCIRLVPESKENLILQ